jgi:hypothetical protein
MSASEDARSGDEDMHGFAGFGSPLDMNAILAEAANSTPNFSDVMDPANEPEIGLNAHAVIDLSRSNSPGVQEGNQNDPNLQEDNYHVLRQGTHWSIELPMRISIPVTKRLHLRRYAEPLDNSAPIRDEDKWTLLDHNQQHWSNAQERTTEFENSTKTWNNGYLVKRFQQIQFQIPAHKLPQVRCIVFLGMGSLQDTADWDRSHRQTFASATFARNFMEAAFPQRQIRVGFVDFNYTPTDEILIRSLIGAIPGETPVPFVSRNTYLSTFMRSPSTMIVIFTPKAPWREVLADCLINTDEDKLPAAVLCRAWNKNYANDQVSNIHKRRWDALGYNESFHVLDENNGWFENIHLYKRPSSA